MSIYLRKITAAIALSNAIALTLSGCGGGGGAGEAPAGGAGRGVTDTTAYSSLAGSSLATPGEAAATSTHNIALANGSVAYVATAGHLTAHDPRSGASEASFFYVAYTVAAPAATRPLIFLYNGGPGSATVWLHLGSFAPRRIVTNDPSLDVPLPFQLVDNADSLIGVADLVFVDAVGSGFSEAVAPNTNQTFWGVDADAAVMRDFISRYITVNQRALSPIYILGESYGTTRSAVLAELILAAGMRLDGVILQSSLLDYNANCDVFPPAQVSCEGNLPSYAEIGAYFGLSRPAPADPDSFAASLRSYSATVYGPAVTAYLATRQLPPAGLVDQLVALTGAPSSLWNDNFDLDADSFRGGLIAGQLIGRYDARVHAPLLSAAAADGDPSSTILVAPFADALRQLLSSELLYSATSGYTLLSEAIDKWDFSHDGRQLPDSVPDLAAALVRQPALRVLSIAGYHDLATPFRRTELDVARLGTQPTLFLRTFSGGHMTYLDDRSRPGIKAVLAAFVSGSVIPGQVDLSTTSSHPARDATRTASTDQVEGPRGSKRHLRTTLAQGGDPYLPPRLRRTPPQVSPAGSELAALVQRKITAHDRETAR